ncbi:MAG: CgeB family protein [Pararhizobium sp.]
MRFLFYTHSLVSDWNHGNAHFLRGVMRELIHLGHEAVALEPCGGWSRSNLVADQGPGAVKAFRSAFPDLTSISYGDGFDHEERLGEADVVLVHEWTDPALVARIGRARRNGGRFTLIFHDTHHRAVSSTAEIGGLDLDGYDLVLAFGETLRQRYLAAGWGRQVHTWHEAADTRLFRPMPYEPKTRDLIWIGNWGDGERTAELSSFLFEPVRRLGLTGSVRGVRYPAEGLAAIARSGLRYGGWIANSEVPRAFAAHRLTVHVPRRPYVTALPGIPTIRVFEALACGIPLISAPWDDAEGLFRPGRDFLYARNGREMKALMRDVLGDRQMAAELARNGLETIRARHTCRHRVEELLGILGVPEAAAAPPHPAFVEAAQ